MKPLNLTKQFLVYSLAAVCLFSITAGGETLRRAAETDEIREKLETIIIPKVDFEEATIHQVVRYLQQKSRELDPKGEGVNFILHLHDNARDRDVDHEGFELEGFENQNEVEDLDLGSLTLSMRNVPLGDLIRFICMSTGLEYLVDPQAVIISDRELPVGEMHTRFYSISPGIFREKDREKEEDDPWGW